MLQYLLWSPPLPHIWKMFVVSPLPLCSQNGTNRGWEESNVLHSTFWPLCAPAGYCSCSALLVAMLLGVNTLMTSKWQVCDLRHSSSDKNWGRHIFLFLQNHDLHRTQIVKLAWKIYILQKISNTMTVWHNTFKQVVFFKLYCMCVSGKFMCEKSYLLTVWDC